MHHTLSDYISDLAQNSVEAGSSVIIVDLVERDGSVKVYISDNGCGMDKETLSKVRDPFFTEQGKHDRRRVGLGIPFLSQQIAQCGGTLDISSQKDFGTSLFFSYDRKNPDAPPVGDLVNALVTLMGQPGEFELKFTRTSGDKSYSVSRSEATDALGDLRDAQSLIALRKYLRSIEEDYKS